MRWLSLVVVASLGLLASAGWAADAPKRVLLVTHSGGFMHDSIGVAEQVLKELGPKHGLDVKCFRFTNDPDARVKVKEKVGDKIVEKETTALEAYSERYRKTTGLTMSREDCGRINAGTLARFDAVLFFTSGNPLTKDELQDLITWVRKGRAFAGTHCASDTLYGTPYGELVGGYFAGHPWHQKVKLKVEDPKHAGAKGFMDGAEITDEIYQFSDTPYSRDRLHVILSIDNGSIDISKGRRKNDNDYAVAWCQQLDQGRSFYTSLGHRKEVWKDPRFQEHLLGGLKWALKQAEGDATPSGKKAPGK